MNTVSGFKYAWMRLIAMAWSDKDVMKRLLNASSADVRNAFKSLADFEVPDDMHIIIYNPKRYNPDDIEKSIREVIFKNEPRSLSDLQGGGPKDDKDPKEDFTWGWDGGLKSWLLPSAIVLLPMPPPPEHKEADQGRDLNQDAMALAAYQWIGRALPLSCC
ncbi:hypothetical protein [Sorangium sp. So ce131]|uniref:hypothetical protein n=1 Tax=Sorangium sp. So ce131 TaxID=3133282 RepID=UPI003F6330B8